MIQPNVGPQAPLSGAQQQVDIEQANYLSSEAKVLA